MVQKATAPLAVAVWQTVAGTPQLLAHGPMNTRQSLVREVQRKRPLKVMSPWQGRQERRQAIIRMSRENRSTWRSIRMDRRNQSTLRCEALTVSEVTICRTRLCRLPLNRAITWPPRVKVTCRLSVKTAIAIWHARRPKVLATLTTSLSWRTRKAATTTSLCLQPRQASTAAMMFLCQVLVTPAKTRLTCLLASRQNKQSTHHCRDKKRQTPGYQAIDRSGMSKDQYAAVSGSGQGYMPVVGKEQHEYAGRAGKAHRAEGDYDKPISGPGSGADADDYDKPLSAHL